MAAFVDDASLCLKTEIVLFSLPVFRFLALAPPTFISKTTVQRTKNAVCYSILVFLTNALTN